VEVKVDPRSSRLPARRCLFTPPRSAPPRIRAADGRRASLQAGFQADVQEFCHQEDRKARSKEASGKEGGNGEEGSNGEEASGGEEGSGEEASSGEEGGGQPEPNEEGDEEAAFVVFVQPRQEDALRAREWLRR